MLKHFTALLTVAGITGVAAAQLPPSPPTRIYSHPLVPSATALNRLNLKLGWHTFLPVEGARDGLATVQAQGDRVYAQARNGAVVAVNAETGQQVWRTRSGPAYQVTQALGFNHDTVFGVNGTRLFALDKNTGRLKYDINLPNVPTTPPVADSERVYVCLTGNRLLVYRLPDPDVDVMPVEPAHPGMPPLPGQTPAPVAPGNPQYFMPESVQRKSSLGTYYATESWATTPLTSSSKPAQITYTPLATATAITQGLAKGYELPLVWQYSADARLDLPPLLTTRKADTSGYLVLPTASGQMFGSSKVKRALAYSFRTAGAVSAPLGQHGDIAYIPYEDATVVAMNIETGRLLWRLAVGGVTRRKPIVTDEDVYLTPDRAGLYRVNRANGEVIWQNQDASRFLAANRKFVYALDASSKLLVLDRARGIQLSSFALRDYQMPIDNEHTDRLFLGAHDGLLLALYDRDFPTPAWNKQVIEEKKFEPRRREEMKEDAAAN